MSVELDALAQIARVEPPPELDALVRGRYRAVVERRGELSRNATTGQPSVTPRVRVAVAIPLAERCMYVLGLLAFGAQASAAHWLWHTLTSGR
jgi:hypothetical protein